MSRTNFDNLTHATLKYWWNHQDSSGPLVDSVGGVNLTVNTGVELEYTGDPADSFPPPFTPGDPGVWVNYPFAGTGGCFNSSISDIPSGEDIAIEVVWAQLEDVRKTLMSYRDSGGANFHLEANSGGKVNYRDTQRGEDGMQSDDVLYSLNDKNHLVVTRTDTTTALYFNGVSKAFSFLAGIPSTDSNGTIRIGAQDSGDSGLRGVIADVRIYYTDATNTSLPAAQFWADRHAAITAGGSNIPAIMNHYRRLRAA